MDDKWNETYISHPKLLNITTTHTHHTDDICLGDIIHDLSLLFYEYLLLRNLNKNFLLLLSIQLNATRVIVK